MENLVIGLYEEDIVFAVIISAIFGVILGLLKLKKKGVKIFILEIFLSIVYQVVVTLLFFGIAIGAIYLFGIGLSLCTLGLVDFSKIFMDMIFGDISVVKSISKVFVIATNIIYLLSRLNIINSETFEGLSVSENTTTVYVSEPNNYKRILPKEVTIREESGKTTYTVYDPEHPKVFCDKYEVKKK